MAVINTLDVQGRARRDGFLDSANLAGINTSQVGPIFDIAKKVIAKEFWLWYALHAGDKIYGFKFFIFSKTIRVSDIRFVFVMLFGEPE